MVDQPVAKSVAPQRDTENRCHYNHMKYEINLNDVKSFTSQKTQCVFITKISQTLLFIHIIYYGGGGSGNDDNDDDDDNSFPHL